MLLDDPDDMRGALYPTECSRYRIRVMHRIAVLVLAIAPGVGGCVSYEYEEEVFLGVDGSGRLRVSGSSEILEALYGAPPGELRSMRSQFEGDGFEIDSVRETERRGRSFVHVQGRFADWNQACELPAFRDRECSLGVNDDGVLELRFALPSPQRTVPGGVPSDAILAIRFHFPSTVRFHNSSAGIERGNIIGWKRTVSDHFRGEALVVHARFERRSVLATTAVVIGAAVGIVLLSVTIALFLIVRRGRKQLAREADGSLERNVEVKTHTPTAQRQ